MSQLHSAIHFGGAHALEISYLTACDHARVTRRCTTNESLHKNMFADEAAIRAHSDRASDNPDRRRAMRAGWMTTGLA